MTSPAAVSSRPTKYDRCTCDRLRQSNEPRGLLEVTVLLSAPCIGCKAPVQVVRRPLRIYGMVRIADGDGWANHGWRVGYAESTMFSVAVVLDAKGEHRCRKVARAA